MSLVEEKTSTYTNEMSDKMVAELYSKADVMYFLLDADGMMISFNITSQETLEYEKDEMIGKNFLSLVRESRRDEFDTLLRTCLNRGHLKGHHTIIQDKFGRDIHVIINGLVENADSDSMGFIRLFIRNITYIEKIKQQQSISLQLLKMDKEGESELIKRVLHRLQQLMNDSRIAVTFLGQDGEHEKIEVGNNTTTTIEDDAGHFVNWDHEIWEGFLSRCHDSELAHYTRLNSFWTIELQQLLLSVEKEDVYQSLEGYQSLGVIPFHTSWQASGYFIIINEHKTNWEDSDFEFIEQVLPILSSRQPTAESTKSVLTKSEVPDIINVPILGILLVKSGKVHQVNKWIESFLEYRNDEIIGMDYLDLFNSDDKESVLNLSNENYSEEENHENICEVQVLTKSQEKRLVKCARHLLASNGDSAEIWYWINKEDRHKLQEQLMHARRMESLGMLAGGIVHDFNNLLACILGYSSLLSEEISKESPYYNDVQQITRTSEKATELTSRLMAYAQGGSYIVDALDVNHLIKEVAAILSRTLDKKISIRAELDSELDTINADASQIQQAILQIALNSRDAMFNGGKLTFHTRNIYLGDDNAWLRFGGKKGRYIQITISDTGSGMSGQVRERIFEPYFSTKNKGVGQGLGLSIVQEIVEQHGGFISVFSEKDQGTVFKLHLPSLTEQKSKSEKPVLPGEKPPLGKETILLVDDEKVLRETARKMLTRYGYKVISAENGREALMVFKKYVDRIDLVILDAILPGIEMAKIFGMLKKVNPRIKVIASAGVDERSSIQTELEQNIDAIVQKPFQVRPLLKKIRSVLNA